MAPLAEHPTTNAVTDLFFHSCLSWIWASLEPLCPFSPKMQLHRIFAPLKRSLHSVLKHHKTGSKYRYPPDGSFGGLSGLLLRNGSVGPCSRADFFSSSSKGGTRGSGEAKSKATSRRSAEVDRKLPSTSKTTFEAKAPCEVKATSRKSANVKPKVRSSSAEAGMSSRKDEKVRPVSTLGDPSGDGVQVCADWWISCFQKSDEAFESLDGPLRNIEIWVVAYQRVHLQVMGDYADRSFIFKEVAPKLRKLINAIVMCKYVWGDQERIYVEFPEEKTVEESSSEGQKKTSKRISSLPMFQDRIVQEALLLILEPIFEARFSSRSHAFRPGRDTHTALRSIRRSFPGSLWFIKGNASALQDEIVASRALDAMVAVVRDRRVLHLIRSGILTQSSSTVKDSVKETQAQNPPNWGSCGVLSPLLCNIFLDQLDCWMDEKIKALFNREQAVARRPSSLLFKPAAVSLERTCRMEYIRYGTEFLIASNSTREEVEQMQKDLLIFFHKRLGMKLNKHLTLTHSSMGVMFLDHVISHRVVHPVVLHRTTAGGRVIQKKALGTVLSMTASRQQCRIQLQKEGFPSSISQINKLLEILNEWFRYADNRKKVIHFCQFILCSSYTKVYHLKHKDLTKDESRLEFFRKKMKELDKKIVVRNFHKVYPTRLPKNWVPEHERCLRDLAWMLKRGALKQPLESLKSMEILSPQKNMSRLVWQFLRGFYPEKGDYCSEPEKQMQTNPWVAGLTNESKGEELAHSAG